MMMPLLASIDTNRARKVPKRKILTESAENWLETVGKGKQCCDKYYVNLFTQVQKGIGWYAECSGNAYASL
jgi:hypothetical protein